MSSEQNYVTEHKRNPTGPGLPMFTDVEGTLVSMQDIIGRKWHPIIVYHLLTDGPLGFSALKERTDGISSKMLSDSLDDLESAGLVDRSLLSDRPVRVEYQLTESGETLEPLIMEMVRWGAEHDITADPDDESDSGIERVPVEGA